MADALDALTRGFTNGAIGRRRFLKQCAALGVSLPAAIVLLDSAARHAAAAPGKAGGQFVYVDGTDAVTLDPHASPDVSYSFNLVRGPAEPLVEYVVKPNGEVSVGPRLAKSWKANSDFTVWTFELNSDIRFHDRTPFNAAAVVDNFNRILSLKLGPAGRLGGVKSVEALDRTTVRFTLPARNATFIYPMTQMLMISPAAWRGREANRDQGQAWAADNVVGTGPFVIESRTKGSQTIMRRFPDYWRGWSGPHVDSVVVKVAPDATTRRLMLVNGEAALANNIATTDLADLERNPEIAVSHVQAPGVQMAGVRFRGPLRDANLRQALTWAFDSEGFIKSTLRGRADIAHGDIYTSFPYFNQAVPANRQDMNKAKSFLAKSGTPRGGVTVTLLTLPGFAPYQTDMATVWQEALKELNITLNIQPNTSPATFFASMDDQVRGADLWAWSGAAQTPDHVFQARRQWYSTFTRPAGVNGGYSNPKMDSLIDTIQQTRSAGRLRGLWAEIQAILAADVPFIPFFIPLVYQVKRKGWAGLPQNPFDLVPNYYGVYQT